MNDIKKFLITEIIIFILIIILTYFFSIKTFQIYEDNLIKNNAYIFNTIINKHPELKDELIESIIKDKKDYDKALLKEYGLTEESLILSKSHKELKKDIILKYIIVISSSLILLTLTFTMFYIKDKRKLKKISTYMNNILNDNYSLDIRDYKENEISNLKNEIYKVTIKLKEQSELSLKDKKQLEETLSDISHQLKTPLTSMYVINDVLLNEDNKKVRKEFLQKNYNQLNRIEWLITSLLKISRLDSGTIKLDIKKNKVINIIDKAIEPLKITIELKNINMTINCPKDIEIDCDLNWTREALLNIIKNAYEHTKENGTIKIEVTDNPIYTLIEIKDNGEGIKQEDIKHIFERFYKVNSSKESIGIGLNMTKKILDLESADISVKSKLGEYTTFSIKFYKNIITKL